MDSTKVGILTVPYITTPKHLDLSLASLMSFKAPQEIELINMAVVNKIQSDRHVKILRPYYDIWVLNTTNNLSKAWNHGIKELLNQGCEYVLIPNLDVELREDTIPRLVSFAKAHPDAMIWSATECSKEELKIPLEENPDSKVTSLNFSCFMVNSNLPKEIGLFDEQFQVYHGDNDIHRRIVLAGKHAWGSNTAKFYHYSSATIKESVDPAAMELTNGSSLTRDKYIAKHGGNPGEEVFEHPYDDPEQRWFI